MRKASYLLFIIPLILIITETKDSGFREPVELLTTPQKSAAATVTPQSNITSVLEKLNEKQPVTILTYGDSITWGYQRDSSTGKVIQVKKPYPVALQSALQEKYDYKQITVINRGHPGWTSIQALHNIKEEVLSYHPDLVITMFGINDARGHNKFSTDGLPIPVEQFKENYRQMLQQIRHKGIEVVIMSPTTITSKKNNADNTQIHYSNAIISLAQEESIPYINGGDIPIHRNLSDGVHFKAESYALLAEKIIQELF